jgi:ABC-2 type transport system permease protein
MLYLNIRHEIRLLSRNYWFISLTIVLVALCVYAGHNGLKQFERRQLDQTLAIENQLVKEQLIQEIATALSKGEENSLSSRLTPMSVSIFTGRLATMPANAMSKLAIGQSDLYTHQLKIAANEDLATLSFNELNNPVQLLFGNFDLSFVLAYLVPLVIIAFTYNLRTQELESGRLKLLASNPVNTNYWLLQRFIIRYASLAIILTLALLGTILWVGVSISSTLLIFFLLTYAYLAFWFAISYLVNILGHSSARNAVSLLSLWILLVLIVPTVINQAANTVYPMPSRVLLLNEIRETKSELSKEQDKVLDEYLRNHPELIRDQEENAYAYWQGYYASQEMMEKTLSPVIDRFDEQLSKQQKWVDSWGFLSPAVIFQDAATQLAETSSKNYNNFKEYVRSFSLDWRAYFMPFVFNNKPLEINDLNNLPEFEYSTLLEASDVLINISALMVISVLLATIGLLLEGKRQLHQLS